MASIPLLLINVIIKKDMGYWPVVLGRTFGFIFLTHICTFGFARWISLKIGCLNTETTIEDIDEMIFYIQGNEWERPCNDQDRNENNIGLNKQAEKTPKTKAE